MQVSWSGVAGGRNLEAAGGILTLSLEKWRQYACVLVDSIKCEIAVIAIVFAAN
jgi:hypothetical protein